MKLKNARTLGIRLDATDTQRIDKFEMTTHIEAVSLARAALKAALTTFEATGSLTLPLRISDSTVPQVKPSTSKADQNKIRETIQALNQTVQDDAARIRKGRVKK